MYEFSYQTTAVRRNRTVITSTTINGVEVSQGFCQNIRSISRDSHNVFFILENEKDAIHARIEFVGKR